MSENIVDLVQKLTDFNLILLWKASDVTLALTCTLRTTYFNLLGEVILDIGDQRILIGVIKLVDATRSNILISTVVVSLNVEGIFCLLRFNLLEKLPELLNLNLHP